MPGYNPAGRMAWRCCRGAMRTRKGPMGSYPMRMSMGAAVVAALLAVCAQTWGEVTISAAISMKAALEEARPELGRIAGQRIQLNFGASGTLAVQIRQGSPVDVYISADRANVAALAEAGKIEGDSIVAVAGN
jgi:molybdate transport system substrate-binding protein